MQYQIGLACLLQSRAEMPLSVHAADRARSRLCQPVQPLGHSGNSRRRTVGSSVANNWSFTKTLASVNALNKRRLAGIGVANQRNRRHFREHPVLRFIVRRASTCLETRLQLTNTRPDQAPVSFQAVFRPGLAGRFRPFAVRGESSRVPVASTR